MNRSSTQLEPDRGFRARFTTAEFLRMAESGAFDGMKVELVEGELERMTPPMNTHSGRQASVMLRLGAVVGEARLRGELGIDLGGDTVLSCDAAIVRAPITARRLVLPAELLLVVEIAETTRSRDMGMKRLQYALAGIPNYWVIDGNRAVVHIYGEPTDGDYTRISTVGFGEPIAVPETDATVIIV